MKPRHFPCLLASLPALIVANATLAAPVPGVERAAQYQHLQAHDNSAQRERGWSLEPSLLIHAVPPDKADPSVRRYLRDSIALQRIDRVSAASPLFIYLVGTGGAPDDAKRIVSVAASQGYRVLSLMYDDMPATAQACAHDPDPSCADRFRDKRVFGADSTADIDDLPQESVLRRLCAALAYLDRSYPGEGWSQYLDGPKAVHWDRTVLSGHSQGAGIAAFIAKRHLVQRVVLFSSPWDYYYGGAHRLVAPWIKAASATPPERWFGAYHAREPQAQNIAIAYQALGVPGPQTRALSLPPKSGHSEHGSVSSDGATPLLADGSPAYLNDWLFLIGAAAPEPKQP